MAEPTLGVALIAYNAAARLAECLSALSFAAPLSLVDRRSPAPPEGAALPPRTPPPGA